MKIVITTQTEENYAFHSWNGEGDCPQHWKQKRGSEYVVENYEFSDPDNLIADAERLCELISFSNNACRVEAFSWEVEEDNYLSSFEKSQLENEGTISHFEPTITLEGVVIRKSLDSKGELVSFNEDLNVIKEETV